MPLILHFKKTKSRRCEQKELDLEDVNKNN